MPRHRFNYFSEVFEGLFLLPPKAEPGAEFGEGRSNEHPIVLEGYKQEEFKALLKVMYPLYASHLLPLTQNYDKIH